MTWWYQPRHAGVSDVFVGRLTASGLDYVTYLVTPVDYSLHGVALGPSDDVYTAGYVNTLPGTPGTCNPLPGEGYVARFS